MRTTAIQTRRSKQRRRRPGRQPHRRPAGAGAGHRTVGHRPCATTHETGRARHGQVRRHTARAERHRVEQHLRCRHPRPPGEDQADAAAGTRARSRRGGTSRRRPRRAATGGCRFPAGVLRQRRRQRLHRVPGRRGPAGRARHARLQTQPDQGWRRHAGAERAQRLHRGTVAMRRLGRARARVRRATSRWSAAASAAARRCSATCSTRAASSAREGNGFGTLNVLGSFSQLSACSTATSASAGPTC